MRPSSRFAPVSGIAPARLRFAASLLVNAGVAQLAMVAIAIGVIGYTAITEGVRAVPALRNPFALVNALVVGAMIGAAWVMGGRLLRRGTRGGALWAGAGLTVYVIQAASGPRPGWVSLALGLLCLVGLVSAWRELRWEDEWRPKRASRDETSRLAAPHASDASRVPPRPEHEPVSSADSRPRT